MIWEKIEKVMKEKNISDKSLINMTGISKHYIAQMKTNKRCNPSFQVVCKIADVLGVDINVFRDK